MDKVINIKTKHTEYDVFDDERLVYCHKVVELSIFGERKVFHGSGESYCAKGNKFNIPFGKALAEIRAKQDIDRQIEISFVKYSFDHFLDKDNIKDTENVYVHVTFDPKKLDKEIKSLIENLDWRIDLDTK